MKGRIFRRDRLYKLIRLLVNTVTVISLILGALMLANSEKSNLYLLGEQRECLEQYKGNTNMIDSLCFIYTDIMADNDRLLTIYWSVGLGLPLLFYGGAFLTNYLFPKKNEE